ncbi:hypothetical protein [Pseudomonas nitroreducens]|uniref:Uncharacterized protein n=1 Tax=Pseudomonas nitroreducens TaxID=46680 RepID=A0A6G6J792_PSENT|nr:hypothetical protein [Pseudomonas nitroreducens]QIE91142.1 hypothetical protein G5B91_32820 [Pseudomonas nitroreducens]
MKNTYPVESVLYSKQDVRTEAAGGMKSIVPAGHAWLVVAASASTRTLKSTTTGIEIGRVVDEIRDAFAPAPLTVPEAYRQDLQLSPVELSARYASNSVDTHPLLPVQLWRQQVQQQQTMTGYWDWVSQQLAMLAGVNRS